MTWSGCGYTMTDCGWPKLGLSYFTEMAKDDVLSSAMTIPWLSYLLLYK